jgi:hypothetical protein
VTDKRSRADVLGVSADDPIAPLLELGHHEVESPITCVLTRFGLRSPGSLVGTYRDYHRVVADARASRVSGLLHTAFLLDGMRAALSLSIWSDRDAIPYFGTDVPSHVHAGHRVLSRVADSRFGDGPELWSTKWRLVSVSHNARWGEFDLHRAIAGPPR